MRGQDYGEPFSITAVGTARATATKAAVTGKTYYITDLTVSCDTATATFEVKDGTTTIWQSAIASGTAYGVYQHSFSTPLVGSLSAAVSVTVGTAGVTSLSRVNLAGYAL